MSIRFAGPPCRLKSRMSTAQLRSSQFHAANDNGKPPSDAALDAALRHFARHGLAAARHARRAAEDAFLSGDSRSYRHWLGICRALDRRMAGELTRATGNAG